MSTAGSFRSRRAGFAAARWGQIEGDQVVSQQEGRALGEVVQPRKRGGQSAAQRWQTAAGICPYCPDGMNPVVPADLEIQGNAGGPEFAHAPFYYAERRHVSSTAAYRTRKPSI